MDLIKVRVPATSANCGPGFDSMGLALNMYNTFTYREDTEKDGLILTFSGVDDDMLKNEDHSNNILVRAIRLVLEIERRALPQGIIHCDIGIPPARGLGSSATAIVAGLLIGNKFLRNPLSKEELLALACQLEGHPDNVCPALYGGFTVARMLRGRVYFSKIDIPQELAFVTLIPFQPLSTAKARSVLPKKISYEEAVKNIGAALLLTMALATKDWSLLFAGIEDHLHVPFRLPLIPGGEEVFKKAYEAGAHGVTISGAGSTLIAYCTEYQNEVAQAMRLAMEKSGQLCRVKILYSDNRGSTYQ